MINDTIFAPATALINQTLAIIRISGDETYKIISQIFSKKVIHKNKIVHGFIQDGKEIIDEVVLVCFQGPNSFTGEDSIEINCHGGRIVTEKIMNLLLKHNLRLAHRGEFSQRAFLNGKINLIQAESVNDLIFASNDKARKIAINNLVKRNFSIIKNLQERLLDIIANIEVNIDYPEYDGVGDLTIKDLQTKLLNLQIDVENIVKASQIGKYINDGINILILGQPNVGKSSLLNTLLEDDKAIVSDIPGTTRDYVEGKIVIDDITLNLIDTAGLRETTDYIEKKGIEKTEKLIKLADIILLVVDAVEGFSKYEEQIMNKINNKRIIIVYNKSDLLDLNGKNKINKKLGYEQILISAKNNDINSLITKIKVLMKLDQLAIDDNLILTNTIQISLLDKVVNLLKTAYNNTISQLPVDIINIDLRNAWNILGELTGEIYDTNLLDTMFSRYCLGK